MAENKATTIALKDLSLWQVCNLLPNINFRILVTLVEENEIDGFALDSVEKLEDLELFSPVLPSMKLKAFFTKIMELKETGVTSDLLQSQLVTETPPENNAVSVNNNPSIRYAAVGAENLATQSPLSMLFTKLLQKAITFKEAIEDITTALSKEAIGDLTLHNLKIAAEYAYQHGQYWPGPTPLSCDEIAAVCIYTMESPLYIELNAALRGHDRKKVKPFAKYLLLLNRALVKCPKPTEGVVFRAFRDDVSSFYAAGRQFNWAQLSSSTTNIAAAQDFLCSGDGGVMQGTLFNIELQGKDCCRDISAYSVMPGESEVLFGLMSRFEVRQSLNTQSGLTIVHIVTIEPIEDILHIECECNTSIEAASLQLPQSSSSSSQLPPQLSQLPPPLTQSSSSQSQLPPQLLPPPKDWDCSACTFVNKGTLLICQLCGESKQEQQLKQLPQEQQLQEPQELTKTFVFQNVFDENGVLFHIATKGTTQLYRNPHEAGYVVASRSSNGMFGGGDVKSFVGRTSEINVTADKVNSWVAVDLGAHRSLVVNHFCLQFGWSCTSTGIHFPQNFELQGSNDSTTWETIQRHESDTFNHAPPCSSPNNFGESQPWAHWSISAPNHTIKSFRHFRILQFGPHQGGRYVLALSGLELYGDLTEKITH